MTRLMGFPIKNQLADMGERNAAFDCVPTALAMCLEFLTRRSFDGAAIKDAVYGAGYQGATDAARYVAYCQAAGVTLRVLDGTPAQLILDIKAQLGKGLPCIGTEPDPYAKPALGWSHVVAFHACDEPQAGALTAADPYGGHDVLLPDAQWQARLEGQQIWTLAIEAQPPREHIPAGWHDDGTALVAPNGVAVVRGFRAYILAQEQEQGWDAGNWPLAPEYGTPQLEASNTALGGGTQQLFRAAMLGWTSERGVFAEWCGQELLYTRQKLLALYAAYQEALARVAALEAQPPAPQEHALLEQIKALIDTAP